MIDEQSYFTVAQILPEGPSWMMDLSTDVTTCDTEHRSPTDSHVACAPKDEITACDQVPQCHSDEP